jgi:polyribonucleotide nucleotidyltransferase
MNAAIPEARDDVRPTAPKIISFEIPIDKIGEVIGPKGKDINTITQETGADVAVSDDGVVGTVTIGSKESSAVEEAQRRVELILDPPTAELGVPYTGKVVNITKFGAFVNILPGRDGLLHISKIGGGKRIDRVEDVLNLGDEVEVRVDDIDQSGKLSLSLVGAENDDDRSGGRGGGGGESRERSSRPPRDRDDAPRGRRGDGEGDGNGESRSSAGSGSSKAASFEDSWDAQVREEFGDLGPAEASRSGSGGGGGGGRRGGGGGRRRR